jgi:hypothetical protein
MHGPGNADIINKQLTRVDSRGLANLKDKDYGKFLQEFDSQVVKEEIDKRASQNKTPNNFHNRLVSEQKQPRSP